ncbi:hypothetical protein ONZ51_g5513 [Trametes cubensis]|uniref:Integrase catalytic domain-containing protein n=1 Tax=Trametes cubensis TaxID=1111947 RepID=A0AAD7XDJ7_9APHY|nr:hypothetical protein ONZ51_g5513 [Trametes cubensis]
MEKRLEIRYLTLGKPLVRVRTVAFPSDKKLVTTTSASVVNDRFILANVGSLGIRLTDGLLYVGDRLVIPRVNSLRESLFRCAHDALGHFGFDKSYGALRDSYYWPGMRKELEEMYIPSCTDCQRNKSTTTKPPGPLHPLPVPDNRGDAIAIDFIGPLPSDNGFDCIATVTDRLGADLRLIPTRTNVSASEFATLFFDSWNCENGLPTEIVSDRDKLFVSHFWAALHKLTGVKLKLSTAYHPQTDGSSERTNKSLIQALRYHVSRNQTGWVRALPRVRFALMNTNNASTGFSRFHLHLGRSPRLLPPLSAPPPESTPPTFDADRLLRQIETDVFEARDNLFLAKSRRRIPRTSIAHLTPNTTLATSSYSPRSTVAVTICNVAITVSLNSWSAGTDRTKSFMLTTTRPYTPLTFLTL